MKAKRADVTDDQKSRVVHPAFRLCSTDATLADSVGLAGELRVLRFGALSEYLHYDLVGRRPTTLLAILHHVRKGAVCGCHAILLIEQRRHKPA